METFKYHVVFSSYPLDSTLESQSIIVYAVSWSEALLKALEYEKGFINLSLHTIICLGKA